MKSKQITTLWPLGLAALFLAFVCFSSWSVLTASQRVSPVVEDYNQGGKTGRSLNKPG